MRKSLIGICVVFTLCVAAVSFAGVNGSYIMFGHNSIGSNIISGLVLNDYDVTIVNKPLTLSHPAFGHWQIGKNGDPYSKINGFNTKMRGLDSSGRQWASYLDMAFFKFCYLDFNASTINVTDVFNRYVAVMEGLQNSFPRVKFIWFTYPIGTTADCGRNLRRHQFNTLIREYVANHNVPFFDIAAYEATNSSGKLVTCTYGASTVPAMWAGWASDRGHLNTAGQRYIAEKLHALMVEELGE